MKILLSIALFGFFLQWSCSPSNSSAPYDFSSMNWKKIMEATNFERYQAEKDPAITKEVYYFPGGQKNREFFLLNRKKYGKETRWYESGQVELEAYFINDKKEGVVKGFYKSGNIFSYVQYKNDKKEGRVIYYFPNGQIKLDGFYVNDQLSGVGKYYNEKGELIKTQNF